MRYVKHMYVILAFSYTGFMTPCSHEYAVLRDPHDTKPSSNSQALNQTSAFSTLRTHKDIRIRERANANMTFTVQTDVDLKADLIERAERVKTLREQLAKCREQSGEDEDDDACTLDKSVLDTVNKQASDIYRKRKRSPTLSHAPELTCVSSL